MNHDFQFISKHSPEVKDAYRNIQQILNLVHNDLAGHYTFQAKAVGSYSRNMITKNIKGNTGFDFDFNISPNDPENSLSPKEIKLLFKESLDKFAQRYGYDYAEDSTRVLTIKVKDMKNARILHGADFAFVNDYEDDTEISAKSIYVSTKDIILISGRNSLGNSICFRSALTG